MNKITPPNLSTFVGIPIIDADTHITEVHDLWTSRAPASIKDRVPQIKVKDGARHWVIDGDKSLGTAYAHSAVRRDGYKAKGVEHHVWEIEEVHCGAYDLKERLSFMDTEGITAQIAYPNLLGFGGQKAAVVDPALRLAITQIYNDAMAELQANSGNRIYPMTLLPWWDVKAACDETARCAKMGLKGVNTNSDPNEHGMPPLSDPAWYPLWETCSDLDLPVNFHIGASDTAIDAIGPGVWPSHGKDDVGTVWSVMLFLNNCRVMTNILVSRFLENFPELKIVSVESGVGWIPFMLEAVEYQMNEAGTKYKVPPSEIFKRQIYACSWFERKTIVPMARMIGVDNLLFETDFPHTTCLYPNALQYVAGAAAEFTAEERRKIFGGNAARVYNIPLPG